MVNELEHNRPGLLQAVKSHPVAFWGTLVLVPVVVFFAAAVITYLTPREFLGKAVVQVPSEADVQTQFEVIKSRESLASIVEKLQLVKRWEDCGTEDDAIRLLLASLGVDTIKGTDLLDIEVYRSDPQEAAEMANAVADIYRERHQESEEATVEEALERLNSNEAAQERNVESARTEMIKLNATNKSDRAKLAQVRTEYNKQKQILDDLRQENVKERVAIPLRKSHVVIHERAETNEVPVRPRVFLQLVIGAVGGLLLAFPLAVVAALVARSLQR